MINQLLQKTFQMIFLLAAIGLLTLTGCQNELTPEQAIREFLYVHQPVTGPEFIEWASVELAGHPSRRIYRALVNQGQTQAEEGHPNAVAILSHIAQAWADEKNLSYDPSEWVAMQQVAIDNIRDDPGVLQLWPDE